MFLFAVRIGRSKDIKGLISFSALPYGLMALTAGMLTKKPVHLGFVGSDWNTHSRTWYAPFLDFFQKKAAFLTVPGETMKRELAGRGYDPAKIHILPHAVDVCHYVDRPPKEREFDCIFVGYLDRNKRVDLILRAIGIVERVRPGVRACIVGDGPLRGTLESLARDLGISANVTFAGYQKDPSPFFSNARMVLIASEREGFPFVLVEGMAAGAVPVSTPAGSIPDYIRHGENGLLYPRDDHRTLAEHIIRLMDEEELYARLREEALKVRQKLTFERVSRMWCEWMETYFSSERSHG